MIKLNDENTTRIEEINGVKVIRFVPFEKYDFFKAAFSTRVGGVSEGDFKSMNLSFTRGDSNEKVLKNFELFGEAIGVNIDNMIMTYQTHTTNVAVLNPDDGGMGIIREYTYRDIDGFITNERNKCIVTSYADCVPVFFADPVNKAIAASHSGWRGTVGNISKNTVELMNKQYGSKPCDLVAFIGPSICRKCYEISEDVASEFKKQYSKEEIKRILYPKENGKYDLDLHEANKINLLNCGLMEENIFVTDICTSCNSELLFSHRKSQGKRGGLCGFIWKV